MKRHWLLCGRNSTIALDDLLLNMQGQTSRHGRGFVIENGKKRPYMHTLSYLAFLLEAKWSTNDGRMTPREQVGLPLHRSSNPYIYLDPFHHCHSLFLLLDGISSTAALAIASLPVSLTFVWKMTLLLPASRHISVTSVWPGSTVPAKRTLMFLKGPNLHAQGHTQENVRQLSLEEASDRKETHFSYTAFPAKPNVHRPCRMGTLKPPAFANPGSMCRGFQSPLRR